MIRFEYKKPRAAHNDHNDCQLVCYIDSKTIGEAVASFIENAIEPYDEDRRGPLAERIDKYFAANPDGVGTFGNYTPRGKKRRGLRLKQRQLFCVKLGNERHYFPALSNYDLVTFTRDQVTIRCRCKGVSRANVPLNTVLWSVS
jgi:hypothetical protein